MANISTSYLGLNVPSPVIAGSSGLTKNIDTLVKLEKNGVGAVVLKSLFEEQIALETKKVEHAAGDNYYPGVEDYFLNYTKQNSIYEYLMLIQKAKAAVKIPVIASINCTSSSEWTGFASEIEKAGADALELNIFMLPSDFSKQGEEYEKVYFDIISAIKKQVKIPVAVKIGKHFSGLANFIQKLSFTGIEGIVLFNRFLSFDLDIEKFDATPSRNALSSPEEIASTLRWIALLSDKDKMRCGLIASTGVHDATGAIKLLLAGAEGVQVCSALYKHGPELISRINKDIIAWMDKHKFATIADFRGKMNYKNIEDATLFYRTQYLKFASSLE